jgi:hypothetical protein
VPESIRMVKPSFAVAKHFLKKIATGVLTPEFSRAIRGEIVRIVE